MSKLAYSHLFDVPSPAGIWIDEDELLPVTLDLLTSPDISERRSASFHCLFLIFLFRLEDDDPFSVAGLSSMFEF